MQFFFGTFLEMWLYFYKNNNKNLELVSDMDGDDVAQ